MSTERKPARPFKAHATRALNATLLLVLLLAWAATIVVRAQEPLKRSAAPATDQSSVAAPTVTTAPPLSYGSITGRVMSDDGRPLSNITVLIATVGSLVPSPPHTSSTDGGGRFEFKNLASGAYSIQISAPGYVRLGQDYDQEREPVERTFYRIGDNVNITMTRGGVITGKVTDASGRPMAVVRVRVVRVHDAAGRALRTLTYMREWQTDDRGVYRAWGLEPGGYLVSVGGAGDNPYDYQASPSGDAPTYYPSATRDGASEIKLGYGEEQSGIDIRYRSERGHRISGTLGGAIESSGNAYGDLNAVLIHAASGIVDEMTYVRETGEGTSFTFNGVADGEYDLFARRGFGRDTAASPPLRIKVKGSDITGLKLVLAPLGTIKGRVVLEAKPAPPAPACEAKPSGQASRQRALEETIVVARLDDRSPERLRSPLPTSFDSQPKSDGEFTFGGLYPGRYRLDARLPDERWYVRSITMAKATASPKTKAATPAPAPRAASTGGNVLATDGSVSIGPGTQATGLTLTLAGGAAKTTGRVVAAREGDSLPARLRLYLVPRDVERADDPLRFGETEISSGGTFTLANLAPGRYWFLARLAPPESDANETAPLPLAWSAESRTALRLQAEAARQEVELQPCQQLADVSVRYGPPGK